MTTDPKQLREILSRYRPGVAADKNDPEVQEALKAAAQDPKLANWLETHHHFQEEMQTQFRSIPVPADLKESILKAKPPIRLRPWPQYLALAAAIIFLSAGLWFFP